MVNDTNHLKRVEAISISVLHSRALVIDHTTWWESGVMQQVAFASESLADMRKTVQIVNQ
jgi:hypothetical protein